MLFSVLAMDGTDEGAPARRAAVRKQHLEAVQAHVDAGRVRLGGAFLDDAGNMRGSFLLVEGESAAEVRALMESDIYFTSGVWQSLEVKAFRIAVQNLREANP
jgi:uncharacterized protein YciI